ncbi:MAG: MFS transporter [Thiovulaceae bacterium]|nr:MFS transporter [Sulfurimonadaceae bacterium]
MKKLLDKPINQVKHVLHGFFLAITTTIAEPATILPIIVSYFNASPFIVGFFSSLLKGGAILVQIVAAFSAQTYPKMMPYLYFVFAARLFSWFAIGLVIIIFGESSPNLTLLLMGVGFFIFSFAAGFGTVYFNEILAKIFSHKVRGRTTAIRQFVSGVGAILSGAAAGVILTSFEAPYSFGYLFIVSAFFMIFGILAFATIEEPVKRKVNKKEESFKHYLKNVYRLFHSDKRLQHQIITYLLSYSYLFALPFIILDAKGQIDLSGEVIGLFVSLQMAGAMSSNIVWGYLSSRGANHTIVLLSFILAITTMILASIGGEVWVYGLLFFLIGGSIDGFKLAFGNLILIIAPEEKRPVYIALQSNLTSIGLFFALPGSVVLAFFGYEFLYVFTALILVAGLLWSLKKIKH